MRIIRPHSRKLLPVLVVILIFSCSKQSSREEAKKGFVPGERANIPSTSTQQHEVTIPDMSTPNIWDYDGIDYEALRSSLPDFDLNQDLSGKSLEELRILRNTIPARYGYLFMNADLRHYFYNKRWYTDLMKARWYGNCEYSGLRVAPPIAYTPEEEAFIERVRKAEEALKAQNYIVRDGLRYANVRNIVNGWQYGKLPESLLQKIDAHGFAIVPNRNVQLFHLYEQNDYSQTQNFVSTDLYLQLFHMHYSFMLRGLEENKFVSILTDMLSGITDEVSISLEKATPLEREALEFTGVFFAIPLDLFRTAEFSVPQGKEALLRREVHNILNQSATVSPLLPAYKHIAFPYDLFKPRGHYTRTEPLKKYFMAMQWLQTAPFCLDDDTDFRRAITAAYVLAHGKSRQGHSLLTRYSSILEPTTFLVGRPDNLSIMDLADVINKMGVISLNDLLQPEALEDIRATMAALAKEKNVIKPKIENTCRDKINFMPARFVLDSEILQEMTDLEKRPYPKGLDVFAAFGSDAAKNILTGEVDADRDWDQFLPKLETMRTKYKSFEGWNETVYAKWISGLNELVKPDQRYPSFMQLPSWNKKNLNTALASWAELKHDAILYTEQPSAAECGGGGDCEPPPDPYVVGYVEPNIKYWKSALELLDLTDRLLTQHQLMDKDINSKQIQLRELCMFLLAVSEKEIKGDKLSQQEYKTIELIGTSVESLTLSVIGVYDWNAISGPDKEIAVVADVYTNNQGEKAGILHAAVGYGNDIYVVVEIEDYLYLTKGSTFSYYEFPVPLNNRMTDEAWQEMLKAGKQYPVEPWLEEVMLQLDESMQPEIQEYTYSSGC